MDNYCNDSFTLVITPQGHVTILIETGRVTSKRLDLFCFCSLSFLASYFACCFPTYT